VLERRKRRNIPLPYNDSYCHYPSQSRVVVNNGVGGLEATAGETAALEAITLLHYVFNDHKPHTYHIGCSLETHTATCRSSASRFFSPGILHQLWTLVYYCGVFTLAKLIINLLTGKRKCVENPTLSRSSFFSSESFFLTCVDYSNFGYLVGWLLAAFVFVLRVNE
jgi:hypothetical protein